MSKVKVGDKIKDNDPRMTNRVLRVIEVNQTHCYADPKHSLPVVRIRLDRIHADGKQRRSGFDLLTEEPPKSKDAPGYKKIRKERKFWERKFLPDTKEKAVELLDLIAQPESPEWAIYALKSYILGRDNEQK